MKQTLKYLTIIAAATLPAIFSVSAEEASKGFPSAESAKNLKEKFKNPPKGYGNVPFYWWDGDSLSKERLSDQLDILSDAAIDGFSVSYIHSHPKIDVELNSKGYGIFGKPDPGKPGVFSDKWWETWNWFAGECADKGIGLGLDDYVVGWKGNGYYVDEILDNPSFRNYKGRLKMHEYPVKAGERTDIQLPEEDIVSIAIYPSGENLLSNFSGKKLKTDKSYATDQTIYVITAVPSHELHPDYGKKMVECYFNRFDQRLDEKARKSLNYFFQDELHYDLNIHSWAEDMAEEFLKRKGYDIRPYLPAMFTYIGDITPKARLDYADVLTQLSEERYFKPVFDWHNDRGLIYGCDNNGRGLEPLQYMDYFRATSWFTAPGNDAPARGSSFRQTKVSSSISHLYGRPRTWLEAFHSMGWDSNGEWLTSQLDHHIIAGGNLLCMHGLYYSTHGGWWEWAPPCFHFRMPYWPHMKKWLEYGERLSYLLSQGTHVCDIAVLYPTESMQAYGDANPDRMWEVADLLSASGLDYDFIDYHTLANASIDNGRLKMGDEYYKVLILPDVKAMHLSTLNKIQEFSRNGGIVISTDDSLRATTRKGENDPVTNDMWHNIFKSRQGNSRIAAAKDIPRIIRALFTPDFSTSSKKGTVLHRRIDDRDVFMVMNVAKGDSVFFRAKGALEVWNAKDGSVKKQPVLKTDDEGTWVSYEEDGTTSTLYVFSPGEPLLKTDKTSENVLLSSSPVDGEWEIEIIPTMNNKWGDFRLPASDGKIGPEAREFTSRYIGKKSEPAITTTDLYGFGPMMEMRVLDKSENIDSFLAQKDFMEDRKDWVPYVYSWQYGVKDSPGSQGYHGLKGKLDNRFLILDKEGHQFFRTYFLVPSSGQYVVEKEGVEPYSILIDGKRVEKTSLTLGKGWHSLVVAYNDTHKAEYRLEDKKSYCWDDRQRSAVAIYPAGHKELKDNDPYGPVIASKWFGSGHLPFSPVKGDGEWEYTFETAPGTELLDLNVNGKINSVYIDQKKCGKNDLKKIEEGHYRLSAHNTDGKIHKVTLYAHPSPGYNGAAFFESPVTLSCGKGKLNPGNWADAGALKYFSGGIKYKKTVDIPQTDDRRIELDLGLVDATCEVSINGQKADVLMSAPYSLDISEYTKQGDNEIEVLVYSTLSNHYQSVPSAYRGQPRAGLMGPISINVYSAK